MFERERERGREAEIDGQIDTERETEIYDWKKISVFSICGSIH